MTTKPIKCTLAWIALLLLCVTCVSADTWQDERYHLTMQSPNDWTAMSPSLLARTNAQVSHLTGRGFIAGYALTESDALVFPYMLVQFKPYTSLPEAYRPVAKLDERDRLRLIYELVGAFQNKGPLPVDIDTPQFTDQFGSTFARLIRHEDNGRFDFNGKIPHEAGGDPIKYHTHGVFGRDGIALVSIFSIEDFDGLMYVIENDMRTLKFAGSFGVDALPDEPRAVKPDPRPVDGPDTTEPHTTEPVPDEAESVEPEAVADASESDETPAPADAATSEADATALIVILGLLSVFLVAAAFIAWYLAHQKAMAERERRRARRERIHAAQGTTQVAKQPRPANPIRARSHGNNGRQRRGTTRS